ncbi:MAG: TonB-dependent receptor [Proteobacteria bacterium]|nr:TonB-dependent receptor [Pseudomonadota bacterium]
MIDRRYLYGGTAMAVALSLASFQAHAAAAAAAAAPPSSAESGSTLSELIVTAEKRSERLQDVPVAVTAFGADQRALVGIQSIQDLTDYAPGLSYSSIDNRPYLRGVGRNTDNLAVASAVAIYYNGIYDGANANTILQHSDLFIDTIEVDRGPQNTLHGANSDGGTINYVSKKPNKEFVAEGRAGYANYDKWFAEARVSGPLSDNVRFSLGGNYTDQSGGYFTNLAGGHKVGGDVAQGNSGKSQYVEAQIDANIGEHLDAWAMLSSGLYFTNYHDTAVSGPIPISLVANGGFSPSSFFGLCGLPGVAAANAGCTAPGAPAVVSVTPRTPGVVASNFPGNNPSTANPRDFIQSGDSTNKEKADIAFATNWTYHAPGVDLTYLGGYQKFGYVLNFVSGADAGLSSFSVAGPATAGATCLAVSPALGLPASGCTAPLAINPGPTLTNFEEHDEFYSNEFDVVSTGTGPFQYVGGLYWYHEKYFQPVSAGVEPNQSQLLHPVSTTLQPTPANPVPAISSSRTNLTYDSYAVFGQATYKFNDQWKVTGGLRYSQDHKRGSQQWRFEEFDVIPGLNSAAFGANTQAIDVTSAAVAASLNKSFPGAGPTTINPATGYAQRSLDETWDAVTGGVNVDWTPDRDTLVYAKYDRGYKAGGFTTFTIAANPETNKETVDAFEVGLKKTIARQLTVNAAAFYYDYKNDQIPLSVQNAQGLISSALFNLPTVHISGVELEGVWRPTDDLTLSAQYSHLNAEVSNPGGCIEDTVDPAASQPGANTTGCQAAVFSAAGTVATPATQNLKGAKLPESPPNKFSANALYSWNFEPGKLILSASYIWKDSTYGSLFNRPYALAPSYDIANFRATFKDAKGRYDLIAFVNNAFDRQGYDRQTGSLLRAAGVPTAGTSEAIISNLGLIPPRTYGVEVRYRFQ